MSDPALEQQSRFLISGDLDNLRVALKRVQVRVLSRGDGPSTDSFMFMMGFMYGKEVERTQPDADFNSQLDEACEMRDKLIAFAQNSEET